MCDLQASQPFHEQKRLIHEEKRRKDGLVVPCQPVGKVDVEGGRAVGGPFGGMSGEGAAAAIEGQDQAFGTHDLHVQALGKGAVGGQISKASGFSKIPFRPAVLPAAEKM